MCSPSQTSCGRSSPPWTRLVRFSSGWSDTCRWRIPQSPEIRRQVSYRSGPRPMLIDNGTAVLVCAGPSLDRMSPAAWRAIERAGAVVSVNGSLVATTCIRNRVRFTYAAAMDVAKGLADHVAGFAETWKQTPAWRVSAARDRSRGRVVCQAGGMVGRRPGRRLCRRQHGDGCRQLALQPLAGRPGLSDGIRGRCGTVRQTDPYRAASSGSRTSAWI